MDPISIATSAAALATFAFRASNAIYSGVGSVKNADTTWLQLQSEVDALQSGLESIASTFQSSEIVQLCKRRVFEKLIVPSEVVIARVFAQVDSPWYLSQIDSLQASIECWPPGLAQAFHKSGSQSQSTKLLTSVKPLLNDCKETLDKLRFMLEGMDKPGTFRKPIKALKINLKSADIDLIRHQIRSYSSAMQMTLHMVGICLSIDGNNQVETLGNKLGQQLENLAAQITDMQKKVLETNQDLDGNTTVADDLNKKSRIKHMEDYIQTAEVIFSNGSVYSESVAGTVVGDFTDVANLVGTFGSVLGMNDAQRRRVNQWIPAEKIPEGGESDTYGDNEEDEVDTDLFLARLALAQKRLKAKEFRSAEIQFEGCLADVAVIRSLPQHEVVDLKLDLATACRGSGNTMRQQSLLNDLLKLELPKIQQFHLKHTLAVAYLDDFKLDLARNYADDAMKGRKKLLGRQHESYFETLNLLVTICKAQGDNDTADVYQDLLPPNYHSYTEGPSLAAPSNDIAALKTLSDNGYGINNKKMYFQALDWASKEERVPVVRLLLERGTDINAQNEDGETMLFYACKNGFKDIVDSLLNQGADLKAKAKDKGNSSVLRYALKHEAVLELLLDRGAEIEAPALLNSTPLCVAATFNHIGAVRILLARGANIEGRKEAYETPLHSASRAGNIEIVRLLLDAGAQINSMFSRPGFTPLMCAAINGHVRVVQLLLDRGADPKIKTKVFFQKTALNMAEVAKHLEVVNVLKAARTGRIKSS